jgi:ATP-dependent DNA helicase DinG
MSYKNKADTIVKMSDDVTKICRRYKDQKGIIHTHNFNILKSLLERCPADVTSRFLVQTSYEFQNNKSLILERHRDSENSILVAPAMHEGVDLVDDDGRFSIICKVPYPSLGDPQIKARMEHSHTYYDWRTMCKLCQSYGRIHRHSKDVGVTFILDGDFEKFISRNKKLAPGWFKDAFKFSL